MKVILDLLFQSGIDEKSLVMLVLFLLLVPAIPFLRARVRAGRAPALRPIPGFTALRGLTADAMETGRPFHVSIGVQGIGDSSAAQTLAGLTTLDYLARQSAAYGVSLTVSVADPTSLVVARDVVRRAFEERGEAARFDPSRVRLIAPEPVAYASGVMGILSREGVLANVMVGAFGDEYLLMGESGARKDLQQVVGTGNPQVLPFMYVSADHVLIGEEIFAGGAYLSAIPAHVASLLAQDWMRVLIVLVIIVGVILKTVR